MQYLVQEPLPFTIDTDVKCTCPYCGAKVEWGKDMVPLAYHIAHEHLATREVSVLPIEKPKPRPSNGPGWSYSLAWLHDNGKVKRMVAHIDRQIKTEQEREAAKLRGGTIVDSL